MNKKNVLIAVLKTVCVALLIGLMFIAYLYYSSWSEEKYKAQVYQSKVDRVQSLSGEADWDYKSVKTNVDHNIYATKKSAETADLGGAYGDQYLYLVTFADGSVMFKFEQGRFEDCGYVGCHLIYIGYSLDHGTEAFAYTFEEDPIMPGQILWMRDHPEDFQAKLAKGTDLLVTVPTLHGDKTFMFSGNGLDLSQLKHSYG